MPKFLIKLSKLFLSLLLVPGPWSVVPGPVFAKITERVVAVVNSEVITQYDLDRALAPILAEQKKSRSPEDLAVIRKQALENLIHQKLLEQEIAKTEIEITNEDLQQAIGAILQKNGITLDLLRAELSAKGISFEAYKEQLKTQLRQAKFIQQNLAAQVQLSSQDIQNYRRQRQATPEAAQQVRVAWIYLPFESNMGDKDKKGLVKKGMELAERGRKGEDFSRLIKKYSKDRKAKRGGQREVWTNELPRDLELALQPLAVEAISDPVTTPQGVYVIKLLERMTASVAAPSELSDDAIWQTLFNERLDQEIRNYVLRLRRKAYVELKE